MSRLSEILGVPEGRAFKYKDATYKIDGNRRYFLSSDEEWEPGLVEDILVGMLDNPDLIELIPEKLNLTEQQITAIKGRIAEGTPWAARDKDEDYVQFCSKTPELDPDNGIFYLDDSACSLSDDFYDFITFENSPVYLPDLIKGEEEC